MADAAKLAKEVNLGSGITAIERVSALAVNARDRVLAMPPRQRRWMGASGLLVLAVGAGLIWYAGKTDWKTLYAGLDAKDIQQVAQELSAAGIAYELTEDGGGVRVGADQLDKARIEVVTRGLPQTGRMGFELFDKPNWVGSEFDEKVNYQRAMEGELEHTIGTLAVVRSARVHLVLPKESMFLGEKSVAKASVVLQLRHAAMRPEEAESIRNLVAGAVENLNAEEVTLMDADGRLNLNAPTREGTGGDAERALEAKLVTMLEPAAGRDNVRATVNVTYDESSRERTDEVYDPTQTVALTMQKSEQTASPPARTAGVPGTASNTPGAAAPGSAQAAAGGSVQAAAGASSPPVAASAVPPLLQASPADPDKPASTGPVQKDAGLPVYPQSGWAGSGGSQTMKEENGSYAVTRHLVHEEQGPGRVRRVTAAVVVNDRMTSEGAGKLEHTVWKPRGPEEMRRLEQLAQAAVGFDEGRGDTVVIENVSFSSNVAAVRPPPMQALAEQAGGLLRDQPGLLRTLGIVGVGVSLVMVVVRPMTRQMVAVLKEPVPPGLIAEPAELGTRAVQVPGTASERPGGSSLPTPPSMPAIFFDVAKRSSDAQGIYEHVSAHIRKEPAQSTRLLQSWIGAPAEESE